MSDQNQLEIEETNNIDSVEKYKFEPIKGYPELHWNGKRPFTSTQYYPAQKKEVYGEEVDGWINKLFWGDNLQVMSHLLKEYRGKIGVVYIDPPFDSKMDYKKSIKLKEKGEAKTDTNSFEEKQYTDIWTNDEYLQFMFERLTLIRELLSPTGSIFLHCDWHKSHHLRCLMDQVFGPDNFVNEIIWCYHGPGSPGMRQFNRKHDNIFWYSKNKGEWVFNDNSIRTPHDEKTTGNFKQGLQGSGFIDGKYELAEGKIPEDYWKFAIAGRYPNDGIKRTGYPTEKPFPLLERIILAASNKGDIVFDCFMGSGVALTSAMRLGRKFIGADMNATAISDTVQRLNRVREELVADKSRDNELYNGVEVHNINHYDVFRNPVEAKQLLIEALEIESITHSIYDGQKDGYMVKVMPVNRISTREDLNDLISNFPYKVFEQRKEEAPKKPVETIMLICMGHEPDLKAHLEQECGYKLDIEIVDILRDKSHIEFKRDAEAVIEVKDSKLNIIDFFPMNLMQKLSMQKESVSQWKELVEAVYVDWNYGGSAMEPTIIDVSAKDNFVDGVYVIPDDAGTIKIKIVDLLSEVYEEVIKYG